MYRVTISVQNREPYFRLIDLVDFTTDLMMRFDKFLVEFKTSVVRDYSNVLHGFVSVNF